MAHTCPECEHPYLAERLQLEEESRLNDEQARQDFMNLIILIAFAVFVGTVYLMNEFGLDLDQAAGFVVLGLLASWCGLCALRARISVWLSNRINTKSDAI